jgi:hypothetical protein
MVLESVFVDKIECLYMGHISYMPLANIFTDMCLIQSLLVFITLYCPWWFLWGYMVVKYDFDVLFLLYSISMYKGIEKIPLFWSSLSIRKYTQSRNHVQSFFHEFKVLNESYFRWLFRLTFCVFLKLCYQWT